MASCQKEERQLAVLFMAHPILKDGTPLKCDDNLEGLGTGTTPEQSRFDHFALNPFIEDWFAKSGMKVVVCDTGQRTEKEDSTSPLFKNTIKLATCIAYTANNWYTHALCVVYAVIAEFAENRNRSELFAKTEKAKEARNMLAHHLEQAITGIVRPVRVELNKKVRPPKLTARWGSVPISFN